MDYNQIILKYDKMIHSFCRKCDSVTMLRLGLDYDDVYQELLTYIHDRTLKNFDKSKNASFTTYLYRGLNNATCQLQKLARREGKGGTDNIENINNYWDLEIEHVATYDIDPIDLKERYAIFLKQEKQRARKREWRRKRKIRLNQQEQI